MPHELLTVLELFGHPGFQRGVFAGLIGAVALHGLGLIAGRRVAGWGLVLTGAVVFGLEAWQAEPKLLPALAILAAAGLIVDLARHRARRRPERSRLRVEWLPAALAGVGVGVWLAPGNPGWTPWMMALTIPSLGIGSWAMGRGPSSGVTGAVMAIVVAGAWVTVPETDAVSVALGAVLPVATTTLPPARAKPLASGAMAWAGLYVWMVLDAGLPRPWTVAGALALSAVVPLIALAVKSETKARKQLLVVLIAIVYVIAVTRVADYTESVVTVVVAAGLAGGLTWLMLRNVERRARYPAS